MGESLHYLLNGVSVSLLFKENGTENTLTLGYLAYLIYNTVESLHTTLPPHHPFPAELTKKFTSHLNIGNLIGIKKVRFNKPSKPINSSSPNSSLRPLLGIVILKDPLYSNLLQNAIKHVCITNKITLPIFGCPDHLCISLHELRSTPNENHDLV
jgi:hypothetical protein